MRIEIARSDITRLLTQVARVIQARNTIPILSNVLLSVANGVLTARGTDLDIEVSVTTPVLAADEGEFTVDAKLLGDIAKKAGENLTLEADGRDLVVRSGKSRFKLPVLPAIDFPTISVGGFDTEFDIDLASLVAPVSFAMSNEETRYYLCGVYLHVVDGNVVAVATDGHRLAKNLGQEAETFEGVILPRKLVGLIPVGKVSLAISPTKVRIVSGDTTIVSKLIDGTFPDYPRVIPANNPHTLVVDRKTLAGAADRVATVSTEKGSAVRFEVSTDTVRLSVRGDAEASDEVAADFDGEPLTIGFNSRYVSEILGLVTGEKATIKLLDGGAPALITGEGDCLFVCMPMRTHAHG